MAAADISGPHRTTLEQIQRVLLKRSPWVEFAGYSHEFPNDEVEDVLRPPHVDDLFPVTEDMVLLGRHLGYRPATLSNGALAMSGFQLDHHEPPRLLIRHESRWQTVAWLLRALGNKPRQQPLAP